MVEKFNIAGYCRISVDDELDRDNTSIENQKSIIKEYVARNFPGSTLDFYEDRDRSGYTFEQREGYQAMRPRLMKLHYDILVVKDFSRFSRRNSRGLVELEDLRDAGVRIISIGDSIDYPTYDDWTAISFRFLINEMPVTDASKKVRSVIKRRQEDGRWICSVPYGYVIKNSKLMAYEVEPTEAQIVQTIFRLYIDGWGYKKIANHLTDQHIPTPRMNERTRKEAKGEESKRTIRPEWSIVTVQGILQNDFYIGTLRQGKYTRKKINGSDIKKDVDDHIVFENHHEAIIDYRTFALAQEAMKKRTTSHYRGVKKYDNSYSGLMVCGDCGSPMFPLSRPDRKEAYRCGTYHRRGLKGCTSHYVKVKILDSVVKAYLQNVCDTSADMIVKLQKSIESESDALKDSQDTVDILEKQLADAKDEKKMLTRQCTRELMRRPEHEDSIHETYDELIAECETRISGIENQLALTNDKQNTVIRVNRIASTAISIFDEVLQKDHLDKNDLDLIIDKILVYEDHIHIKLKDDIECILKSGTLPDTEDAANLNFGIADIENTESIVETVDPIGLQIVQSTPKRKDKVYDVHVISNGDPLEIYTDHEGEVIFKKYSPIGELNAFAAQYAETLSKVCGMAVVICDRDSVIACGGLPKKEFMDMRVSSEAEKLVEARSLYSHTSGDAYFGIVDSVNKWQISCLMPILAEGDIIGCVASLTDSENTATETEQKLVQTAASFLGKQIES